MHAASQSAARSFMSGPVNVASYATAPVSGSSTKTYTEPQRSLVPARTRPALSIFSGRKRFLATRGSALRALSEPPQVVECRDPATLKPRLRHRHQFALRPKHAAFRKKF